MASKLNKSDKQIMIHQVPSGTNYQSWLDRGGSQSKYWPVWKLHKLANQNKDLFLRAIIHGSVATLDDVEGFSDLDLTFIVKDSTLTDTRMQSKYNKLRSEILALTYAFDPFMHHEPYYLMQSELSSYPEAKFPLILFNYGVDLFESNDPIEVMVVPSNEITDSMLVMFSGYFNAWSSKPFMMRDYYDVEHCLGNLMILPALFLQRMTGEFRYKRDTFPIAEKYFTKEEWEPIVLATNLRATLGPRHKPSRILVWFALQIHRPSLLQKIARRNSRNSKQVIDVQNVLGEDFPRRVLALLHSMQTKIRDVAPKEPGPRVFSRPVTDLPLQIQDQRYQETTELVTKFWNSLAPKPIAIYQIGQVGAPGISDLDYLIVYPDDVKLTWQNYKPENFPQWVRLLMTHPPYVCTEGAIGILPKLFPIFNYRLLSGIDLGDVSSSSVSQGAFFGMLVDYLLVKIPHDIIWIAYSSPVRIRVLLCMLNSLKYTYSLAERSGISVENKHEHSSALVDNLRQEWFTMDENKYRILEELTKTSIISALQLVATVNESILSTIPLQKKRDILDNNKGRSYYRFISDWQITEKLAKELNDLSNVPPNIWLNPESFEYVISYYINREPKLANAFEQKGCRTDLKWDGGKWSVGLAEHATAILNYAKISNKIGVPAQKYIGFGLSYGSIRHGKLYKRIRRIPQKIDSLLFR